MAFSGKGARGIMRPPHFSGRPEWLRRYRFRPAKSKVTRPPRALSAVVNDGRFPNAAGERRQFSEFSTFSHPLKT